MVPFLEVWTFAFRESCLFPLNIAFHQWWRQRSQMRLIRRGNRWEIEGLGKERARIAYARLKGNRVVYRLESPRPATPVGRPQLPYCGATSQLR